MKIRLNKKTLPYKILLLLIFIVEMHFFGLFPLPDNMEFYIYKNRSKWIALLAFGMALLCYNAHGKKMLYKYKTFLIKYLAITTIAVIAIAIYTFIAYPLNPLITTYGFASYYLYSFLAIPILYIFEVEGTYVKFFKLLNYIAILMYIVTIIQGLYYIKTGGLLWGAATMEVTGGIVREGKIRLDAGAFANIMMIYNTYRLYIGDVETKKEKFLACFALLMGFLAIYFTGQSRILLLSLIASVGILILIGNRTVKKKIVSFLVAISAIIFMVSGGYITSFISSFSASGVYAGSTIARFNAINYYISCFFKNPIFAIGFAGDENYYDIVHGNSGIYYQTALVKYYYSDVGIFGQLALTGIFVIWIYIWPVLRMVKIAKKIYHYNYSQKSLLVAYVIYLILTSFTLIIMDANRILAFPVLLALFEYIYTCRNQGGNI